MSQRKNGKNRNFGSGDGVEGRVSDVEAAEVTGPDGRHAECGARAEAGKRPSALIWRGGVAHWCGKNKKVASGLSALDLQCLCDGGVETSGTQLDICFWSRQREKGYK